MTKPSTHISHLSLDEATGAPAQNPDIEHERKVAIFDLLEKNHFALKHFDNDKYGPYRVNLAFTSRGLVFNIHDNDDKPLDKIDLSLTPFRRLVKDYFIICESYYDAIRTATPHRIESIDQTRRALHNEGSDLLQKKLNPHAKIDEDTARRLFTLLCALNMRS